MGSGSVKQCSETISNGPRTMEFHQCFRKGTLFEDGRHWCKQHAPSSVKARQQASCAKYDAKIARLMRPSTQLDEAIALLRQVGTHPQPSLLGKIGVFLQQFADHDQR